MRTLLIAAVAAVVSMPTAARRMPYTTTPNGAGLRVTFAPGCTVTFTSRVQDGRPIPPEVRYSECPDPNAALRSKCEEVR